MSAPTQTATTSGKLSSNKITAAVVWCVGCYMTSAGIDQMTGWGAAETFIGAVALQWILTKGQSPIWRGDFGFISVLALIFDAVFNFGGCMSVMVNVDKMGSVQSIGANLFGFTGEWPLPLKAALAFAFSCFIAGLPEHLWNRKGKSG